MKCLKAFPVWHGSKSIRLWVRFMGKMQDWINSQNEFCVSLLNRLIQDHSHDCTLKEPGRILAQSGSFLLLDSCRNTLLSWNTLARHEASKPVKFTPAYYYTFPRSFLPVFMGSFIKFLKFYKGKLFNFRWPKVKRLWRSVENRLKYMMQ